MKNGKLFGKLNIIDILILLVVVVAIALVGYKLVFSTGDADSTSVEEQAEPNVRFTVRCEELPADLYDHVITELENGTYVVKGMDVSGCRIYNSGTLLDAYVTSWDGSAEREADTMTLNVTVEARATLTGGAYTLQYQDLRLGKEYVLKTLGIELTGTIVALEKLS